MTDAELHMALREVVAIGRRGGYDNDEIAEKLARVVRDYADDTLTGFTQFLASANREDWKRWADVAKASPTAFAPCPNAPHGMASNCFAMDCETRGCAVAAAKATPPGTVSLDDLR